MKKIIFILLTFSLFACKEKNNAVILNHFDGDTLNFEVTKIDTGWGYNIYKNNKLFIKQELIPAVNGHFLFKNAEDAAKTAMLVISKMSKKSGLPALTIEELDSIGVLDSTILNFQKIDFSTKNNNEQNYLKNKNKK